MTGNNLKPMIRIFSIIYISYHFAAYNFIDIRLNDMKQNDFEEDKPKNPSGS